MSRSLRRLHVTLAGSEPEIWRDFSIADDLTLLDLHRALQIILGWRESHMHIFSEADPRRRGHDEGRRWGTDDELALLPEDATTIADAFSTSATLWYEYDLGDGWLHRVETVGQGALAPFTPPVTDIDGESRAPYEDAGGVHGYLEKLAIANDPMHPDHAMISSWIRRTIGPWLPTDPAFFDPLSVQSELNLLFHPQGAGLHPYDMSGIVKDDARRTPEDVQLDSPIADLLGALPVPVRSELRQKLHRGELLEPTNIDDDTARRIVAPYAWLVEAIGPDGINLTAAGWLPPRLVLDAMTTLGWAENWVGKGNREDITVPVALLRETAQRMGLIRVQKGRLLLGAHAKRALGDPTLMLRLVATRAYRGLKDYERYAAILQFLAIAERVPPPQQWEVVAFGLEMLGWQSTDPSGFSRAQIGAIATRTSDIISVLSWHDRRRRDSSPGEELVLFAREALR